MTPIIRFGKPIALPLPKEKLPAEEHFSIKKMQIRNASFQVYVTAYVVNKVWQHVNETPRLESGGVLIGHPFQCIDDPTITFVIIVDALQQESNNRSVSHYTVGPTEIARVRAQIEKNYAGLKVVGWYHSHPGHGVFLSQQDMQIVQSLYNAEWHLAWVLDTIHNQSAFFFGPQGCKLTNWLEYKQHNVFDKQFPTPIRAINLYNRWLEEQNGPRTQLTERLFQQLRDLVIHTSELSHWYQKGFYQNKGCTIMNSADLSKDKLVETITDIEIKHNSDTESLYEIFYEAQRLIHEKNHDAALNLLRILAGKYPTFQTDQVQKYIKLSIEKQANIASRSTR
jgi:proteasome lid subunit RPN8/RPN11